MKSWALFIFTAAVPFLFSSLHPVEDHPAVSGTNLADLWIQFDHVAGRQDLVLHEGKYTNAAGEPFSLTQLQYFVSNIQFKKRNGGEVTLNQDESYFLVREDDPASQLLRLQVPAGDYDRLSFVLGVDSLRNTMPIGRRTGVLDPASSMDNGMYWTWNSGYIFFKMEGISDAAPEDPTGNRKFRYHIGGFGGYSAKTINNIKTISINLQQAGIARPRKDRKTVIHLRADVLKTFHGSKPMSIRDHPSVMFSEFSTTVANNYSRMFSHSRTEN